MKRTMTNEERRAYKVIGKKEEASDVTTLCLVPLNTSRPEFISGQFITVYFPELGLSEGKAYSISSAPYEEGFSITVKDIGAFSHKLSTMEIGDTLTASGPYGFFYSEESDTPLVLLAGGIGIAPFKSIISDILEKSPSRKIDLYYSVKDNVDAVFLETFSSLAGKHPNFTYTLHVTRGPVPDSSCRHGRISVDRIAHLHKEGGDTEYFMCGSIPFVRDMWKGLRGYGIPEERLYTEAFFS
jgi:ferredoxin-NADP reductase